MSTAAFTPLRLVVCHKEGASSWGKDLARELELALFGNPDANRTERWVPLDLAAMVPLEDAAFRSFAAAPTAPAAAGAFLDEALHTLLVVLVHPDLLGDGAFLDWLSACAADPGMDSGRHRLVAVVRGEETRADWLRLPGRPALGRFQSLDFSSLGEQAERVDWLGLRLLDETLRLAARGCGEADFKLRLFVSHAKRDGISLAKSLNNLLREVSFLQSFYDARDLGTDRPWETQLESAVASSVVVALRTDNYDHRPFCQLEVQWAEEYGSPLVLVDARGALLHAATYLPLETAPCVRIPDGNLVRVLHAALRVAARSQLFRRRVVELQKMGLLPRGPSLRVIPVSPGMGAIATACRAVAAAPEPQRFICYPEPRLSRGRLEAAKALAISVGAVLVTPRELLLDEAAP